MHAIESLILLLGGRRLTRAAGPNVGPVPVFLVLGGLAIGFVPGLPAVEVLPR